MAAASIEDVARRLAEEGGQAASRALEPVLTVEARNVTPVIPGGAFTDTVITVNGRSAWAGIRPTAVRGVWRWWVRALLAGVLWDEGVRNYDYRVLTFIEAKHLGMGSVEASLTSKYRLESSSTLLTVDIESVSISAEPLPPIKFRLPKQYFRKGRHVDYRRIITDFIHGRRRSYLEEPWKYLLSIPRYLIWTFGKNSEKTLHAKQPIPPNSISLRLTLKVRRVATRSDFLMDAALAIGTAALQLAIQLGGLGQATSRGFGKFSVSNIEGDERLSDLARRVSDSICSRGAARSIVSAVKNLISKSSLNKLTSLARGLAEALSAGGGNADMPATPTVHPDTMKTDVISNPVITYYPVGRQCGGLVGRAVRDAWDALVAVGNACIKVQWKCLKRMPPTKSGRDLHTWPLGLPRAKVKRETGLESGYALPKDHGLEPGRLQSLVRFTPVTEGGRISAIVAYAFYTNDLRELLRRLKHVAGNRRIPVSRLRPPRAGRGPRAYLDEAFETALKMLGGGRP